MYQVGSVIGSQPARQDHRCALLCQAYDIALQLAGATAGSAVLFDDSAANLASARELGFYTVLVRMPLVCLVAGEALPSVMFCACLLLWHARLIT